MAADSWPDVRYSFLGQPVSPHLARVLESANKVILVVSPSAPDAQVELLSGAAARPFAAVLRPLGSVDRTEVNRLRRELARLQPDAVVALGGGTIMDVAKALARPQPRLVLVPTTLSGSEQTANTSWWDQGQKVVKKVGMADVVIADPELVVPRLEVLGPGALHSLSHSLATLIQAEPGAGSSARAIVTVAAIDLIAALRREETDVPTRALFQRGAWNAAVGFRLTGPRIGPHHFLVHRLSIPGEQHARVSSGLLCAALLQTGVYVRALEELERAAPGLAAQVMSLAERWAPLVGDAAQKSVTRLCTGEQSQSQAFNEITGALAPSLAPDAEEMLGALKSSRSGGARAKSSESPLSESQPHR